MAMREIVTKIDLPQFTTIALDEIELSLDRLLTDNRDKINRLITSRKNFTWDTLIQPIEDINDRLHHFWAPVSHLNSVVNSPELRDVYHACLPKLMDYSTELSHHEKLFHAIQSIAEGTEYQKLDMAQKKVIDNEIRDFKLAGVTLSTEKKQYFAKLVKTLSQLQNKFEENLLDATQSWYKQITNENELRGLPEHAKMAARQTAKQRSLKGWIFTLEIPSYLAVITYAGSRTLREEMYTAFVTRASDQGPNAGHWDNSTIMEEILCCRLELAKLLGFSNFAEYSLTTRMLKSPKKVIDFLNALTQTALPKAKAELKILCEFSKKALRIKKLEAWDIVYASEKLRKQQYDISQEDLRPYFPEPQVIQGLFKIVNRLFQITIKSIDEVDVWHPDVRCYGVYDNRNHLVSYFYFDLYAREKKRGGAWMDNYQTRRRLSNGKLQLPIAFIVCNLNPPVSGQPVLFSHDEVNTLFHEFGHALQHMLTKIDYAAISGIHGIPWDAVELASQFLENWVWQKESLHLIARHYQSGESLSDNLFQRLNKAKNFHAAMQIMRQLEFALLDMRLHMEFNPKEKNQIQHILDEIRSVIDVITYPPFNRFQHSFSHIFAGGYAAGYYSYKWAEMMAADAFSVFEENGIFDYNSAQKFLTYILEPGGSKDPMDLFKAFRNREPNMKALLRQRGIL
ncbi:M3 family metallopeptidase [Coxiella endosymbiont of Amblyomma nuttalli]|uniref:M3 family metallopeptidase n=1 Tax=Coxiella endosymbiont of Amblyomma nuttalli TaxID=2749996 RepID=UPI001BB5F723|nr:M3 family metallopeptidase [Coxiella endosymbiont of Amblyomma nuttalli]QTS84238.1 Oligopeptidase A [Coxiella endosymbiont of Amblyomma nuttalli]